MPSRRRAFVAAVAAVLGGCTDGNPVEQRPDATETTRVRREQARGRGAVEPYRAPFVWGTWTPDIVLVNYGLGEVTAAVVVRWPEWIRPAFKQRLVLPGRIPNRAPPSEMIPYVQSLGEGTLLTVTTTNGTGGTHLVRDDDVGIRVNLHGQTVDFQQITT